MEKFCKVFIIFTSGLVFMGTIQYTLIFAILNFFIFNRTTQTIHMNQVLGFYEVWMDIIITLICSFLFIFYSISLLKETWKEI